MTSYPKEMQESIARVEATRPARLSTKFPRLSLPEQETLLKGFHPDYRPEGKRKLRVGPSWGEAVPHELADLLEAYPLLDPKAVDVSRPDLDVDVLVIGGGGAGTVAAIWAHASGIPAERILIATKLRHGDSNSIMAQGGSRPRTSPTTPRRSTTSTSSGAATSRTTPSSSGPWWRTPPRSSAGTRTSG